MRKVKHCWVICSDETGLPVPPIDTNEPEYQGKTDDPGMLAYLTKAGCEAAALHQENAYGIGCHAEKLG